MFKSHTRMTRKVDRGVTFTTGHFIKKWKYALKCILYHIFVLRHHKIVEKKFILRSVVKLSTTGLC